MYLLIMLSFYVGLFICLLLYLKKTNAIKTQITIKAKQKTISKRHGKSNVKQRIKRSQS